MGRSTSVQSIFFDGHAVPVDASAIDAELRRLWAESHADDGSVVRTCMANLVVYAGTAVAASEAAEAIDRIAATHLVRAVVLVADESADEANLNAWLSAHCQIARGRGPRVCCEQVLLAATGNAVERLPSAVLPLLVPDLPVVVWWMGDPPFGATLFEQLVASADRLIVDTTAFEDPTFSLTRLASLARSRSGQLAVCDLNWARLTPWQEQLAQAFDSAESITFLDRIARLTVAYQRVPHGRSDPERGLLLAGWFLNRLGWKQPPALTRIQPGHFRGRLRRAGRELVVEIMPRELPRADGSADLSGTLLTVEAQAGQHAQDGLFSVERRGDDLGLLTTVVHLPDLPPIESTSSRPRRDLPELLSQVLEQSDHDYLFEAALETAAHLSGALQLLPH